MRLPHHMHTHMSVLSVSVVLFLVASLRQNMYTIAWVASVLLYNHFQCSLSLRSAPPADEQHEEKTIFCLGVESVELSDTQYTYSLCDGFKSTRDQVATTFPN